MDVIPEMQRCGPTLKSQDYQLDLMAQDAQAEPHAQQA
jgi:hypothetical protein